MADKPGSTPGSYCSRLWSDSIKLPKITNRACLSATWLGVYQLSVASCSAAFTGTDVGMWDGGDIGKSRRCRTGD
jgi:hypothetical protein